MTNNNNFSNYKIVTLALYNAGGKLKYKDTEDVGIEADKISPGRFRWAKRKEMISDAVIKDGLYDARKKKNGELVTGVSKTGWLLTEAGIDFCEKNQDFIEEEAIRLTRTDKTWKSKEKNRLLNEIAHKKYVNNSLDEITKNDVEAFFRINHYITGHVREKKIKLISNHFSKDIGLKKTIDFLIDLMDKAEKE